MRHDGAERDEGPEVYFYTADLVAATSIQRSIHARESRSAMGVTLVSACSCLGRIVVCSAMRSGVFITT